MRWLASKTRAIAAVEHNLEAVVLHLENSAQGSGDDAAKAKGYLKTIRAIPFIKTLYFLMDYLPLLSNVSKVSKHPLIFIKTNEQCVMEIFL